MKYKTFIIGLGQIGMGYDYKENFNDACLTHLNAILAHESYDLVGGFDLSFEKRREFEFKTKIASFENLKQGLLETKPDFVIISTPTKTHFEILKLILDSVKVKVILCEKPISYDYEESLEMVNLCYLNNVKLFINYQRYYLPSTELVEKKLFPSNINIEFLKGVCWYSKGILHNGSHFINLLEYWLGELVSIDLIESHFYWSMEEIEPDALLTFKKGKIFFLSSRETDFSNYSIEILTSEGKLNYNQGGEFITWQSKVEDKMFPGYTSLSSDVVQLQNESNRSQFFVMDNISRFLSDPTSSRVCEGYQTLNMIKILSKLKVLK